KITHDDVKTSLPVQHLSDGLASDRRLYNAVDVVRQQAVARGALAVGTNEQIRLTELGNHAEILDSTHRSHDTGNVGSSGFKVLELISKKLDRVLALNPGHRLFDVVLNGL